MRKNSSLVLFSRDLTFLNCNQLNVSYGHEIPIVVIRPEIITHSHLVHALAYVDNFCNILIKRYVHSLVKQIYFKHFYT